MKIFSTLLLLAALSVGLLACQKDSDPAPAKTSLLTEGVWVHESSGLDMDRNGSIDLPFTTAVVPACLLDNTLLFKKDHTAVASEGATQCDPAAPPATDFNWSFADNESSLAISSPVFSLFSGNLKIVTLTNAKLTLSKDTTLAPFGTASVIVNLKH